MATEFTGEQQCLQAPATGWQLRHFNETNFPPTELAQRFCAGSWAGEANENGKTSLKEIEVPRLLDKSDCEKLSRSLSVTVQPAYTVGFL